MSSHLVAGVPLPDAVGGHPALDFCNTRAGWGSPRPKEYLASPLALALWGLDAGLVDAPLQAIVEGTGAGALAAGAAGDAAAGALARALVLRDALYRCALGAGTPQDWHTVAREAVAARAASTLEPGPDGARWTLDAATTGYAAAALHAAAAVAEELLTSPLAGCVAACPGTGCGWLFADPRRRRRWCTMAICGNRAKARRHAERHHPTRT
jgi:predicted RNA-binding Zn ribbon-like protein